MTTEDALIKRLSVTPEQLIGYAYGGLLAVLILAIIQPSFVQSLVSSLGGILATLVALGVGVGIYVLYFKVIGEFALYLIQHAVHRVFDWVRKTPPEKHTSCVAYLGYMGVGFGYRRAAYETIKASCYEIETCRRMQVSHGELHVLYLTAVETGIAAGYLWIAGRDYTPWLLTAGIAYIAALIADTRQHFLEAAMLRAQPEAKIRKFLTDGGFLSVQ